MLPPRYAKKLALQLSQEDPFQAWLPLAEGYEGGGEYSRSEKEPYKPWIVWPSIEARLDETDPLGVTSAVRRLHFTKAVNAIGSLRAPDPFKRTWADLTGRIATRSKAWGRKPTLYVSPERIVANGLRQSIMAELRLTMSLAVLSIHASQLIKGVTSS